MNKVKADTPQDQLAEYEFGRALPEPVVTLDLLLKFAQNLQTHTEGIPDHHARMTLRSLGKVLEDTITGKEHKPCGCGEAK